MRPRQLRHRVGPTMSAAVAATLFVAAPAWAHIDPDPTEVPAGAEATVQFTVEHGCEESPTTKLEIKVPASVTDAAAVDKEGWTGSTTDGVVTFEGGPLDAHTEAEFGITFTAPDTEGEELRFPIVQTCEEGSIDWIAESEEDEHPAPVVTVGAAGSDPVDGEHNEGEGEGEGEHEEATTTTVVSTSVATTAADDEPGDEASGAEDDGDDDNAWVIPVVIGAVAVIGGGTALALRARKKGLDGTDVDPEAPTGPGPDA